MQIPVAPLQRMIRDIFHAEGCSTEESERLAKNLVGASLTGHDSHGVLRTPKYVWWLREGHVVPNQQLHILAEGPAFALADGCRGFGQTIAPLSVELGMRKAGAEGVAVIAQIGRAHV